ncbi:hypothetical protein C8R47DRAFT_1317898 [Mycena vitilis]|nr:hypothetical protein C8R47DRAFT_1317898 [Mycena vitilis]
MHFVPVPGIVRSNFCIKDEFQSLERFIKLKILSHITMFKQLFFTAVLAIAFLTHGAMAVPQTPPTGIGATCGTYLGVTYPACDTSLVCCQVEVTPAMSM